MSTFFGILSFAAFVCFIIGMIKPQIIVFWTKKKSRGMASLYLVACIIFGIIAGITGSPSAPKNSVSSSTVSSASSTASKAPASSTASSKVTPSAPANVKVDKTLESGNYTVGIDLPAGTYNFTAVKGAGNVTNDDGTINEIMGTKSKGSEYTPTFSNAELQDGEIIHVSGVTLQVTSNNASGIALKKRSQSINKDYTFGAGNYTAGKDFNAGTYDITAVSGNGNVTTEDGTLNAIMGTDTSNDMYEKNYYNVDLSDGAVLQLAGSVKVRLTPSK